MRIGSTLLFFPFIRKHNFLYHRFRYLFDKMDYCFPKFDHSNRYFVPPMIFSCNKVFLLSKECHFQCVGITVRQIDYQKFQIFLFKSDTYLPLKKTGCVVRIFSLLKNLFMICSMMILFIIRFVQLSLQLT